MYQYLLFVGGHDAGSASIDWRNFLGSYEDKDDARKKVPVSQYYAILDGQSGAICERGHRDAKGEYRPITDAPS